jgi:hypothetical protein
MAVETVALWVVGWVCTLAWKKEISKGNEMVGLMEEMMDANMVVL